MPASDSAEIPRQAREDFCEQERVFVVVIEDRGEPHCGLLDELQKTLADEEEAAGVVKAAAEAVGAYEPEREAVGIDERTEGIVVVIVGRTETRVVGEFF